MPDTELCHVPVRSLAGLSWACNDGKSAENNNRNNSGQGGLMGGLQSSAIVGTVSAISGSTITVAGNLGSTHKTPTTTFTVNAANAQIARDNVISTISSIVVGDSIAVQGTVTGTNVVATVIRVGSPNQAEVDTVKMSPNVVGKVSVITGNILTVVSNKKYENESASTTTFTVDATNAKLLRGNTAITLSDIIVGDNIVVQGTITGTNVVATIIRDGKIGNGNENDNNQALLQIQGDGQPVVAGTISAINGSIITIANSSNITYTVDASNAKIVQGKNIILLPAVKTGDSVIVQGAVNGTSVTASTIIDQANQVNITVKQKARPGFFGSISQWFRRLFRF